MSSQPMVAFDLFEQLKRALSEAPASQEYLAGYVRELEVHRNEEDIFLRLAFEHVHSAAAYSREGTFVTSVSQLYDPLDPQRQVEIRHWWHGLIRRKAKHFDDLRARLELLEK